MVEKLQQLFYFLFLLSVNLSTVDMHFVVRRPQPSLHVDGVFHTSISTAAIVPVEADLSPENISIDVEGYMSFIFVEVLNYCNTRSFVFYQFLVLNRFLCY